MSAVFQGLRREQRLRRAGDFAAVRRHGFSRAHPLALLRVAPNGLDYSRFAFVVSRRVAKQAAMRNRVRRRLREATRRTELPAGWDLIFVARPEAIRAGFSALRSAVWNLSRRALAGRASAEGQQWTVLP